MNHLIAKQSQLTESKYVTGASPAATTTTTDAICCYHHRTPGFDTEKCLGFLFFKSLESVVTWDTQYSLPGEAPGSGNIFRVRRFRFGRRIAI
jgi:hypothetical protein